MPPRFPRGLPLPSDKLSLPAEGLRVAWQGSSLRGGVCFPGCSRLQAPPRTEEELGQGEDRLVSDQRLREARGASHTFLPRSQCILGLAWLLTHHQQVQLQAQAQVQ